MMQAKTRPRRMHKQKVADDEHEAMIKAEHPELKAKVAIQSEKLDRAYEIQKAHEKQNAFIGSLIDRGLLQKNDDGSVSLAQGDREAMHDEKNDF